VVGALEALGLASRLDGPDVAACIATELAVPVDGFPLERAEQVGEAEALELGAAEVLEVDALDRDLCVARGLRHRALLKMAVDGLA